MKLSQTATWPLLHGKKGVGQGAMLLTWIDVHSDNNMHHHCLKNVAGVGLDEHRMEGVLTVVSSITQQ